MNEEKSLHTHLKALIDANRGAIISITVIITISFLLLFLPRFAESATLLITSLVTSMADALVRILASGISQKAGTMSFTGIEAGNVNGGFYSFKFVLWALVIPLAISRPKGLRSLYLTLSIILLIVLLNIIRLVLASYTSGEGNLFTSGAWSLPYRIILFLLPLFFILHRGAGDITKSGISFLKTWRENQFIIFIAAAVIGSLPGLLYGSGFFLFDGVIWIVFSMAKGMLAVFSVTSSFTGRYLTNEHTSIYMSDSCAGLKTIFMLISLILLGKGKTFPKISFAAFGVLFLLILNAIRVTILFEINNEGAPAGVFDWWHSNFKYLFYIAVMALWLFWLQIQRQISREPQE
jgi:exosortase/archaeosortase family protein